MKNTLMLRQFVDTIHTQFVEHEQIAFLFIEEERVPRLFGLGKVIFAGHAKNIKMLPVSLNVHGVIQY